MWHYQNKSIVDLPDEDWRDIKGYEGYYQVSNLGRVRSCERKVPAAPNGIRYLITIRQKIMTQTAQVFHKKKYCRVGLNKKGKKKMHSVHRLVAIAFLENFDGKPQVNHINGETRDNTVSNLEWCTASENIIHSFKSLGRRMDGDHHVNRKLSSKDVLFIRSMRRKMSVKCLAAKYGVHPNTITEINTRKSWKTI
jgi:hypothetical protein